MRKSSIGIDRCKFELNFKNQQRGLDRIIPIYSRDNFKFGEILMERGKVMLCLCLPKYFEVHNAVPFRNEKLHYFNEIRQQVVKVINSNFEGLYRSTLTSIEMNITEVISDCDYEKVFLLLSHSLLDTVKQNARYEIISDESIVMPMTSGIKTRLIKGKWILKAYDKKKQIESEYDFTISNRPIRIEFVFSRLAIEKMFGNKSGFDLIFSKVGMNILVNAYKETLGSLINEFVYPRLENIHEQMMLHIRKTNSIQETYCEFKEVIYDQEQLRRVLKDWNEERGMNDNSRSTLSKINKKYNISKGTLRFINELLNLSKM